MSVLPNWRALVLTPAIVLFIAVPCAANETATGARQPSDSGATAATTSTDGVAEGDLTAEEKAERESRKACKADICSAFRNKQSNGSDIACSVVKSWRKEQLSKLVGKLKVSWPYEGVRCTSAVNLKRADLAKVMGTEKVEIQLDKHSVACVVNRPNDAPTDIKFDFSPKVTFEGGKAIKAKINWGKIEAPALIKSALWTATAADNTVNMLSSTLVDDINDFVGKKCDDVKDQWAGK
jgi:hypothetical protein